MADAYFQLDPNKGQVLSDAVVLIDDLFSGASADKFADDLMGDTFEYLLSEISSSGKNGQFRTPRHLIRFMVELVDPAPNQTLIDPASGTCGFLFCSLEYLLRKYSPTDSVKIEWDGTPHRVSPGLPLKKTLDTILSGRNYVGIDNDRTMVRIGWMNLFLHGVSTPYIFQADSLSRSHRKSELAQFLVPESYDLVLANPPFTGTVDIGDVACLIA